jgi:hypothetical protein
MRSEGLVVVGVVGSMDTEPAVAELTDRAIDAFGRIDLIVSTLGGAHLWRLSKYGPRKREGRTRVPSSEFVREACAMER